MQKDPTKPLIISPCHSRYHPGTMAMLEGLKWHHGWDFKPWFGARGVDRVRAQAASEALTHENTYFCWTDDDNFVPAKVVAKLYDDAVALDLDFLAAVVPVRRARCVANFNPWELNVPIPLGPGGGIRDVRSAGLALALTHRRVFETLAKTLDEVDYRTAYTEEIIRGWPFFLPMIDPVKRAHWGEDYSFCERVRAAGMRIHVDTSVVAWHAAETLLTLADLHREYEEQQAREIVVDERAAEELEWL